MVGVGVVVGTERSRPDGDVVEELGKDVLVANVSMCGAPVNETVAGIAV